MSCLLFFTRQCSNYTELYANLHYLTKAREHLENYQEMYTFKQNLLAQNSNQTSNFAWKHKPEQQSLIKQMTNQEIVK